MASQISLKFPKNKKAFSKKTELATITEDIPSSYRPDVNISFYHNGIHFTLDECQLICSLRKLGADDDLVSEIIKHERRSSEPVNCDGLNQDLLDASSGNMKDNNTLSIEAARLKAQNAYLVWMEYMTGVVWWYQERGRDQEVLSMAPDPFYWMTMIPPRPLLGDISEPWYSWNEPGWDIGPAVDTRTEWE